MPRASSLPQDTASLFLDLYVSYRARFHRLYALSLGFLDFDWLEIIGENSLTQRAMPASIILSVGMSIASVLLINLDTAL
jgi:hypothetical protein